MDQPKNLVDESISSAPAQFALQARTTRGASPSTMDSTVVYTADDMGSVLRRCDCGKIITVKKTVRW